MDPSRQMMAPIPNLISMHKRNPLNFTPTIAQWNVKEAKNVTIIPTINGLNKNMDNKARKETAERAIEAKGPYHTAYWTDASVLAEGQGSSACISKIKTKTNPYKRGKHQNMHNL